LTLPNLDDRSYADLVAEARALIPALAPDWTDHNPADPGITLVELFAWLTEMLLYRVNQVTDDNRLAFLRLMNGGNWQQDSEKGVAAEIRDAVLALRQSDRAVTAADFERLALAVPGVARAHCLPRRNLELGTLAKPADPSAAESADVSVVILPKLDVRDEKLLLEDVSGKLEPARLLTTRLHVVARRRVAILVELTVLRAGSDGPFTRSRAAQPGVIAITLTVHARSDAIEERVLQDAETELLRFLDPYIGGADKRGWPFGRSVYISEIYDLLARLPEADHVTPTDGKAFAVEGFEEWRLHDTDTAKGELAAIELSVDELPEAKIPEGGIAATVSGLPAQ
jgi:hypothetical protein